MKVIFSQSFLNDLGRIDNIVLINDCKVDGIPYRPEIVYHERVIQACIVDVEVDECDGLEFYYGESNLAFTVSGEGSKIKLVHERTIFEVSIPQGYNVNATIGCPWLTEDTKFLESIGFDLGNSFYKDIEVSNDSLIWKPSIGKYIIDRGLQEDHTFSAERLDTKEGYLEDRPIKFKSYQNIKIDQKNWGIDSEKKVVTVKHDTYSDISSSIFFVWDSPMIDSTVELDVTPDCIDNLGKYTNPGSVVFGNTDCFQYIKFQDSLRGFRLTGTEGSKVKIQFNQEYTGGDYTSFECVVESSGVAEVRIPDSLPYYHLNGIVASGPSRIEKIEVIQYLEESVEVDVPNPDKTFVVDIENIYRGSDSIIRIKIDGTCDYIEYEKYLGVIKEIGRGTDHINSIPELDITPGIGGNLDFKIDNLGKVIECYNSSIGESNYKIFSISIQNNISVVGNSIITSELDADYKIRINQNNLIWKFATSPDYIDYDTLGSGVGIYTVNYLADSERIIKILTNDPTQYRLSYTKSSSEITDRFDISAVYGGTTIADGEEWHYYNLTIKAKLDNDSEDWVPQTESGDPCWVMMRRRVNTEAMVNIPSLTFIPIQLREFDTVEVWEELLPGKFSKVSVDPSTGRETITAFNSLTKNFVVVKRTEGVPEGKNWYYYDLTNTNNFYLSNYDSLVTNTGPIYYVSPDTEILDLNTSDRRIYGRIININRSDLIGDIGILTITEFPSFPSQGWRSLINSDTKNVAVTRELSNIYVQIGNTTSNLKNEDYVLEVSRVGIYYLYVKSNFKYIADANEDGYLRFFENGNLTTRKSVLSGYSNTTLFRIALVKLDEESGLRNSYIEIKSGNVVRKVTIKVNNLVTTHDYYTGSEKPDLIRIFENGALSPETSGAFLYKSTTTPKFNFVNVNSAADETKVVFSSSGYNYHSSTIPITIPNSGDLKYSKFPMQSFGSVQEVSLSYSSLESGPLEYYFYMKGKKHYLWCVDNISDFSGVEDPTEDVVNKDLVVDAGGDSGINVYIVSRYGITNWTFKTVTPRTKNIKISRNNVEATFEIGEQEKLNLDKRTQIEYSIPIKINCNVPNTGGNIFLGKLTYQAVTKITDTSLNDVINIPYEISDLEGIDETYIKNYIVTDQTQSLNIRIFQLGSLMDVFRIYSDITDFGIKDETKYIIPEVGSNINIINLDSEVTNTGGKDDCYITTEYDQQYFLVTVHSRERFGENDDHWFTDISSTDLGKLIQNTNYTIKLTAKIKNTRSGSTAINTYISTFTKHGCNYGLYVEDPVTHSIHYGFGGVESELNKKGIVQIEVPAVGGWNHIHAGLFYAVDGIWSTEALDAPAEFEFVGANKPTNFTWEGGNKDDKGNLFITIPPRLRDDSGYKHFYLRVIQPDEYAPMNLYIDFAQKSFRDEDPDTEKIDYVLGFTRDTKLIVFSDGTVEGDDRLYFVHNLNEALFQYVTFGWEATVGTLPKDPDDLTNIEEIERSYEEGYVRLKFKPNGSGHPIFAKIVAKLILGPNDERVIGTLPVEMGHFSLAATYYNPYYYDGAGKTSLLSRISPKRIPLYSSNVYTVFVPCLSNSDNADATKEVAAGRGVFKLVSKKQDYYDPQEITLAVNEVLDNVELISFAPDSTLDSYGVSIASTSSDPDALINPLYNNGNKYITNTQFSTYNPYLEFSYKCKKEFLTDQLSYSAASKITLVDPNTGRLADFYFSTSFIKAGSDELVDVDLLSLSDDTLKFGYEAGSRQVSYYPASFNDFEYEVIGEVDWLTIEHEDGSNFFVISVEENKTTEGDEGKQAFFRSGQIKIDVLDDRTDPVTIIKTFYIEVEQDPDIPVKKVSGEVGVVGTVNAKVTGTVTANIPSAVEIYGTVHTTSDPTPGPTPTPSGVKINYTIENNTTSTLELDGGVKFYLAPNNEELTVNFGAASGTTVLTLGPNSSSSPYNNISCVSASSDPETLVGSAITGCIIYRSSVEPYTIATVTAVSSSTPLLEKDGVYTLVIGSNSNSSSNSGESQSGDSNSSSSGNSSGGGGGNYEQDIHDSPELTEEGTDNNDDTNNESSGSSGGNNIGDLDLTSTESEEEGGSYSSGDINHENVDPDTNNPESP